MALLKLLVSEDDTIPLLLGFIAVNGDLRLYTDYLASVCHDGKGGSKRLACRFIEHLATVKEPIAALEKLGEEVGGAASLIRDIARSLRLGLEPSELAERIIEKVVTKLRARAELIDEIARASLESLALISTILTVSLLISGVFLGSKTVVVTGALLITGLITFVGALLPSIMSIAAPRLPYVIQVAALTSIASAVLSAYLGNIYLALLSILLALPLYLFARKWWKQVRSISRAALQLAEMLQLGRIATMQHVDNELAYNMMTGSRKGLYSNLGLLLIDIMRLLPQEGSVTAARLLRSFVEFATRYLDIAKAVLTRSLIYEAIVTTLMPILAVVVTVIAKMISASFTSGSSIAPFLATGRGIGAIARLMLLPSVVYPIATSKIGRGTPFLPFLHWLPALVASLVLH